MECVACEYVCIDAVDQKKHYKSDWHRYNLRLRVREMPSIGYPAFLERLDAAKRFLEDQRQEHAAETCTYTCVVCRKTFSSKNACTQHLGSKKHRTAEKKYKQKHGSVPEVKTVAKPGEDEPESLDSQPDLATATATATEDVPLPAAVAANDGEDGIGPLDSDEEVSGDEESEDIDELALAGRKPIAPNCCLFCNHTSSDMEESMEHMKSVHSFYLPEEKYIKDKEGMLKYLGEKVGLGHLCLFCAGDKNGFKSLEATRSHMRDKKHCQVCYNSDFDRVR